MAVPTMSPCTFIYSPHPTFGVHKVSTLLGRLSIIAGLDYWTAHSAIYRVSLDDVMKT